MRLRIGQKLYLGTVLIVSAALVSMTLMMGKSFEKGFSQYLNDWEALEISELKEQLISTYDSQGGWSFLRLPPHEQQSQFGFSFGAAPARGPDASRGRPPARRPRPRPGPRESSPRPDREPGSPPGPHQAGNRGKPSGPGNHPPPPRGEPKGGSLLNVRQRVAIVNLSDEHIAGPRKALDKGIRHTLTLNDETIGFLMVTPVPSLQRNEDLQFARHQSRNAMLIGLLALTVAALASLWMARWLTAPLPRLAQGARRLAQGHYDERVAHESGDEFGQLGQDFNQLAGALERHRSQEQSWIAQISHELRTPLAIITGEIHALQDGVRELDDKALDSLDQESQRLTHLVEDLFFLSVTKAGGQLHNPEQVNLSAIVGEFFADNDDIELMIDTSQPALITGDPFRLRQLLANLLQNSRRYTHSPTQIRVTLKSTNSHWVIVWEDSPPGVPEQHLEHLFDPLYRVESSRARATGGAGLGLAIVHSVALAHDGEVSAMPSTLGGLKIVVSLPHYSGS